MADVAVHPCIDLFQREIDRFRECAQQRCGTDGLRGRRKNRRYHRSWPLSVALCEDGSLTEYSAALYDASEAGMGFMCSQVFCEGSMVYIKLFWHEATGLHIPAIVRHVNPGPNGVLVGVEFALSDAGACEKALQMERLASLAMPRPPGRE